MMALVSGIFLAGWWALLIWSIYIWYMDKWDDDFWKGDYPPIGFLWAMVFLLQIATLVWVQRFTE